MEKKPSSSSRLTDHKNVLVSSKDRSASSGQPLVAIAPPSLKVIIMNASGARSEKGSPEKRRTGIQQVVHEEKPHLILFQEFGWVGITGKTWEKAPIPDNYQYTGNKQGSVMYDSNELIVEEFKATELQAALDELKRKVQIQNDFAPIPRMCIRKVKTKGVPHMEVICVSWHGSYAGKKKVDRIRNFIDLQIYLLEISKRNENMMVIIGGDFNINITEIKSLVRDGLRLWPYTPTDRRRGAIIDFYIASDAIQLEDIKPLDLEKIVKEDHPFDLFDHDPVVATLRNVVVSLKHDVSSTSVRSEQKNYDSS